MKISVWEKYNVLGWVSLFITLTLFLILSIIKNVIVGLGVGLLVGFGRAVLLHSIKCPKCKKPVDNWTTIFSGNNDGLFCSVSKKCKCCGYDFTKKD